MSCCVVVWCGVVSCNQKLFVCHRCLSTMAFQSKMRGKSVPHQFFCRRRLNITLHGVLVVHCLCHFFRFVVVCWCWFYRHFMSFKIVPKQHKTLFPLLPNANSRSRPVFWECSLFEMKWKKIMGLGGLCRKSNVNSWRNEMNWVEVSLVDAKKQRQRQN